MNVLDLCAGYGGFSLALKLLGDSFRTICYVERDAFCQALLVARMEEKALDPAPLWDDVTTFDGRRWRGKVDIVTAGFPCQPVSNAGKRGGLRTPVISGLTSCESFAKWDRVSSSWRMSEASSPSGSGEYSKTWPVQGTMQNGVCFLRKKSERRTDATACLWWPTPAANNWRSWKASPSTMKRNSRPLHEVWGSRFGMPLPPTFSEMLMGLPCGWTACGC